MGSRVAGGIVNLHWEHWQWWSVVVVRPLVWKWQHWLKDSRLNWSIGDVKERRLQMVCHVLSFENDLKKIYGYMEDIQKGRFCLFLFSNTASHHCFLLPRQWLKNGSWKCSRSARPWLNVQRQQLKKCVRVRVEYWGREGWIRRRKTVKWQGREINEGATVFIFSVAFSDKRWPSDINIKRSNKIDTHTRAHTRMQAHHTHMHTNTGHQYHIWAFICRIYFTDKHNACACRWWKSVQDAEETNPLFPEEIRRHRETFACLCRHRYTDVLFLFVFVCRNYVNLSRRWFC